MSKNEKKGHYSWPNWKVDNMNMSGQSEANYAKIIETVRDKPTGIYETWL